MIFKKKKIHHFFEAEPIGESDYINGILRSIFFVGSGFEEWEMDREQAQLISWAILKDGNGLMEQKPAQYFVHQKHLMKHLL